MGFGRSILTLVAGGLLLAASAAPAGAAVFEDGVLAELNFARTRPKDYARQVLREPAAYGSPSRFADVRQLDPRAVEEALDFLMRQPPLPPLRADDRIAAAAREHTRSQGRRGELGHNGPSGQTPGQRLQRQGVWAGVVAENIAYGYSTPREVVMQLIVDSGVPGRGHRRNIFAPGFDAAGVACGPHRTYDTMCVIDFAGAVAER